MVEEQVLRDRQAGVTYRVIAERLDRELGPAPQGGAWRTSTASSGETVELGKTSGARRQVPLSRRAVAALDALPPRLDSPLLFPGKRGGLIDLNNWRRREWTPAIEAAGVATPARIYDLRATYASDALAASVSVFELARVMGYISEDDRKPLRGAARRLRGQHRGEARRARCPP